VSDRFEAAIVAARKSALIRLLENLPVQLLERGVSSDPFAPLNLELHVVVRGCFVVFAWRAGRTRPDAWEEVEDLADEYAESGPAVIEGDTLKLADLPTRAKYLIRLTIVAYQYGSAVEPLVQMRQVVKVEK
jgi:hypothetical protein